MAENPNVECSSWQVSREEWMWALKWMAVLLAVVLLPYLLAYAAARPDERFTGVLGQDIDTNTYLTKIRLGLEGHWGYVDRYTSEPHGPMPFYLPIVWWGLVTRPVTRDPAISYRLSQGVCCVGALAASYSFVAALYSNRVQRRIAFLLIALGAGIGWMTLPLVLVGRQSLAAVDMWMQEATLFAAMLSMPHFAAAVALLLVAMRAFLLQTRAWSSTRAVVLVVASAVMILIHPFLALQVVVVASVYLVVQRVRGRPWRILLPAWLLLHLGVGLAYLTIQAGLRFSLLGRHLVVAQLSPPPYAYALGYGALLVLALFGGVLSVKRRLDPLPVIWFFAGVPLLYSPVAVQRRLLEGLAIPICVLAAAMLHQVVLPWLSHRARLVRSGLWIGLAITIVGSNVVLWSIACVNALSHQEPWFVSEDEAAMWNWLLENGEPDEIVLSSSRLGNRIPAHTNKRVVVGHWAETVDYAGKNAAVEQFFDPATADAEREATLVRFGAAYVVQGPDECTADLEALPGLQQVYVNGRFTVFRYTEE